MSNTGAPEILEVTFPGTHGETVEVTTEDAGKYCPGMRAVGITEAKTTAKKTRTNRAGGAGDVRHRLRLTLRRWTTITEVVSGASFCI